MLNKREQCQTLQLKIENANTWQVSVSFYKELAEVLILYVLTYVS